MEKPENPPTNLAVTGIYFLTPEMNFENSHTKGVMMGIISAVFYSLSRFSLKLTQILVEPAS